MAWHIGDTGFEMHLLGKFSETWAFISQVCHIVQKHWLSYPDSENPIHPIIPDAEDDLFRLSV